MSSSDPTAKEQEALRRKSSAFRLGEVPQKMDLEYIMALREGEEESARRQENVKKYTQRKKKLVKYASFGSLVVFAGVVGSLLMSGPRAVEDDPSSTQASMKSLDQKTTKPTGTAKGTAVSVASRTEKSPKTKPPAEKPEAAKQAQKPEARNGPKAKLETSSKSPNTPMTRSSPKVNSKKPNAEIFKGEENYKPHY